VRETAFGDFRKLRFGIVEIKDVNAVHAHVGHAAGQLILQKTWSDAMAAGCNVLGLKDSALHVFLKKIAVGIGGHPAVRSEVAGFRANYHLLARKAFFFQLDESGSDAAFAALKTIVDGGVDHVDAVFDGHDDRGRIGGVGAFIGLPEVGADTKRRKQ
jgi:hypothetical protein